MLDSIFPNDAQKERELLQHILTLAHRECQKEDERNLFDRVKDMFG